MSFQNVSHHTVTLVAAADLSAKQFFGVSVNSAGQAAIADGDDQVIGILQNNPGAGQAATVAYGGVSKAKAAGTIAAGSRVTTNAAGAIVAASTAGDSVIGVALTGGATGDVVAVLVHAYPFAVLA